ncbi:RsmB/NOP family class I SAM-dependent RNA methyltransferase [Pedobacter sp. SAFR-022]|uniref:RsmB/NOP family class I SAM-dependent RNA methyltransferase n=1 Tax=Pedobacter sp. SAFR-022 TaxID=3436861 RepID=UPI003F81CB15
MKVEHQIRTFEKIFKEYDGSQPLHRFLVGYFKANKQMGSSDRRWASRYLYSFFRIGKALPERSLLDRLVVGDFLCNTSSSLLLQSQQPEWHEQVSLPIAAKLVLVQDQYPEFELEAIFPFSEPLSEGIDRQAFLESFFTQPDLFIRVKAKHATEIHTTLTEAGVHVKELSENVFSLPNGTKLGHILPNTKYYQVQDLSSQRTGKYFQPKPYEYWWDCCAASGGKSLLLHEMEPKVQLLVSDVRENSLNNLDERFQEAGINKYQKKVLDLLVDNEQHLHHYEFDGIILDAPCSGSGTWGRTPEMLYYFNEHKVKQFNGLQKAIATNVLKYLKPGQPLIYITCSVFSAENEAVVDHLQQTCGLQLEEMEVIKGYHEKADTMFVARFRKV